MRFFLFWLIRFAGAAAGLTLAAVSSSIVWADMLDLKIIDPNFATNLASPSSEQARLFVMDVVTLGVASSIVMTVCTLMGYRLSKRLGRYLTGVVLSDEAEAVVHPAVVQFEALSPEVRKNWVNNHPAQTFYGITLNLILFGICLLVSVLLGNIAGDGHLAFIGFLAGSASYASFAVLGGWGNRKLRRWFGLPPEFLAQAMFRRDVDL